MSVWSWWGFPRRKIMHCTANKVKTLLLSLVLIGLGDSKLAGLDQSLLVTTA